MDMLNKSRGEIACTLVDTDSTVSAEVMAQIAGVQGVLSVRVL
jgi:D-3-phosphoglycerate dehydrogenase